MALEQEIAAARQQIVTDGYDMSLGEILSLYRAKELIINPDFQRYFRWDATQKTKFIESILLGIPIPPIFVFQTEKGTWELVDGLQRISTFLEFTGNLIGPDKNEVPPSVLAGTKQLPSLSGKRWESDTEDDPDALTPSQQIEIKRSRMRVEILKKGSDPRSKFELFQRLNTGGSALSEQEVRNCVMVMINKTFYEWLGRLAGSEDFRATTIQTETAEKRQKPMELVLRFFAYRHVPYTPGLDVHEYLDDAAITLGQAGLDLPEEERVFAETFRMLRQALGADAFKRWDGDRFVGQFTVSSYETIIVGVTSNFDAVAKMEDGARNAFLKSKIVSLWGEEHFRRNSGMGVRGTTRLVNLLPFGRDYFRP